MSHDAWIVKSSMRRDEDAVCSTVSTGLVSLSVGGASPEVYLQSVVPVEFLDPQHGISFGHYLSSLPHCASVDIKLASQGSLLYCLLNKSFPHFGLSL